MKITVHKILIVFILIVRVDTIHAGFPSGWPFYPDREALSILHSKGSLIKNKSNFVPVEYNRSFIQAKGLTNKSYVAGQFTKAPTKGIGSILCWDFKLKFRLNRNMNIIFSYN